MAIAVAKNKKVSWRGEKLYLLHGYLLIDESVLTVSIMKFTMAVKKKKTRKLPSSMPTDNMIMSPEIKTDFKVSVATS